MSPTGEELMVRRTLVISLVVLVMSQAANATFSIAACDSSDACGVAVATNNLAVGATVPYARAGVGAIATQFETNPNYGPRGLDLLAAGKSAASCIDSLLAGDRNFEGQGIAFRQVSVVSADGGSASVTGEQAQAAAWAGGRRGPGYSIIGNGLAGERVVADMESAFLGVKGTLAQRLMAALIAGQRAGGQSTGSLSAALLVRTLPGGFQDVDLRVDAGPAPADELGRLFGMRLAHEAMLRAERLMGGEKTAEAERAVAEAQQLAPAWERIWLRAARVERRLRNTRRACEYFGKFSVLNPAWGAIEKDGEFRALCGDEIGNLRPSANRLHLASWKRPIPATSPSRTP
jgi:uncharacterized Ntn-hydrolase superfamily protein